MLGKNCNKTKIDRRGPCFYWHCVLPVRRLSVFAPVEIGRHIPFRVIMTFALPPWKLQNENKCHCLNSVWCSTLNIFGISRFFPWDYYLYHLILKSLKEHVYSRVGEKWWDRWKRNKQGYHTLYLAESLHADKRDHMSNRAWLAMPWLQCHRSYLWFPSSVRKTVYHV